jgi:hypothetical protein
VADSTLKAVKRIPVNTICPGGHETCPAGDTCCPRGVLQWGCCPLLAVSIPLDVLKFKCKISTSKSVACKISPIFITDTHSDFKAVYSVTQLS